MAEDKKKEFLVHTITIRASSQFKQKLTEFAEETTKEVDGEVKVSDLVRLGLDWVLEHQPHRLLTSSLGTRTSANTCE